MSPRRLALILAVALAAATGTIGASTARASSTTICVALIVDGRALGSDVSSSCATVNQGATGVGVLRAAGHSVGFRSDGLICTIDGLPKSGCADVDDSHYWAYFHRAPGKTSWTYSTEGPSTYRPANTATEGWIYRDGGALTPPDNVPYTQICKTKPTPKPTPTPTHSAKPSHKPTHYPTVRTTQHSTAPSRPTPTPTPSKSDRRHDHGRNHHPQPPNNITASFGPGPTPAALSGGAPPPSNHHGPLGLIIGLVVVGGLGGLAAYRFRRSP
jgi:cell division septation protein DedD